MWKRCPWVRYTKRHLLSPNIWHERHVKKPNLLQSAWFFSKQQIFIFLYLFAYYVLFWLRFMLTLRSTTLGVSLHMCVHAFELVCACNWGVGRPGGGWWCLAVFLKHSCVVMVALALMLPNLQLRGCHFGLLTPEKAMTSRFGRPPH